MNRMTDERLSEIEEKESIHFPDGSKAYTAKSYLTEELMQALKAEREKVEELEKTWQGAALVSEKRRLKIEELEAQLQVQEQESFGQLKPLRCRIKKLESGLIMIKDDWGECSQIGLCSELGYEMNTWCPYCIAVATLENNNEATIT